MDRHPSMLDRSCAAVTAGGFGLVGVSIVGPAPSRLLRHWSSATIYPWWALVLAVGGVLVAVVSVVWWDRTLMLVGAGISGVLGAELAGLGIVAAKHWRPAFGMRGGYSGDLRDLQLLGLLVFVAGAGAAVASLVRLVLAGGLRGVTAPRVRRTAVVLGGAVLVLLPISIGASGLGQLDATSLAAYALIYSAPWGLAIALSGWLESLAATAVLAACAVCAAVALIGPQMGNLVYPQPFAAFTVVLGTVLAVLIQRRRASSPPAHLDV